MPRNAAKTFFPALAFALAAAAAGLARAEAPPFDPEGEWRKHVIDVSAEAHGAGEYTLQHAFDALPETGGTIALGEGEFTVEQARAPEGRPVVLSGQGPGTLVKSEGTRSILFRPSPHVEVSEMSFSGQYRAVQLADGAYGHVKFHRVRFSNHRQSAIGGRVPGPVERLTVTECSFRDVGSVAANFRIRQSRNMTVSRNEFRGIGRYAIVLGAGGAADNKHAEITDNTIIGVGEGRRTSSMAGILCYADETLIARNTIEDLHSSGQHEAISSRGSNTVIRDNRILNAGGRTGAISLASSGPTVIRDNVIRFTDDHKGGWRAIDLRQSRVRIFGNEIVGAGVGVNSRRGVRDIVIEDNFIGDSPRLGAGVNIIMGIRTGTTEDGRARAIPADAMSNLSVRGNTFSGISKAQGEGRFAGVRFRFGGVHGEHDTRLDDVLIEANVFKDIEVADGTAGVDFSGLEQENCHMRNLRIVGNDFGALDVAATEAKRLVEGLHIGDE